MSTTAHPTELELLLQQMQKLTAAVQLMSTQTGTRLNRQQMADRLGIHRNTLAARQAEDPTMPRPGKDGRFLLSEVIEWETQQNRRGRH